MMSLLVLHKSHTQNVAQMLCGLGEVTCRSYYYHGLVSYIKSGNLQSSEVCVPIFGNIS